MIKEKEGMLRAVAISRARPSRLNTLNKAVAFLWDNMGLTIGGLMLLIVVAFTLFPGAFTSFGPNQQDVVNRLRPGFWAPDGMPGHWLGTDQLGRDLWTRLVYGFRASVPIGFGAIAFAMVIAMTVSLASVTVGGWVEVVLMRLTDVQMSFPLIVLMIVVLSMVSPTPPVIIIVLGLSIWPFYARVTRSFGLTVITADYVLAARAMGATTPRVIIQHLLRNVAAAVMILALIDVASVIVIEATLSFLGLGIQPPTPSFGNIIADGKGVMGDAPWVAMLPGFVIMFVVYGLNLFGDSLHKFIDPVRQK
jgi:peptide/nickel transport system permease protein